MFMDRDPTPPDVADVIRISGLLGVSEFRVFEIAYAEWYGVPCEPELVEDQFTSYMFAERVPHFVRAFTRKARRLERAGALDPAKLGIETDVRTVRGTVRGLFYFACVAVSVAVLVALAKVTAEQLGIAECLLPPCY